MNITLEAVSTEQREILKNFNANIYSSTFTFQTIISMRVSFIESLYFPIPHVFAIIE